MGKFMSQLFEKQKGEFGAKNLKINSNFRRCRLGILKEMIRLKLPANVFRTPSKASDAMGK